MKPSLTSKVEENTVTGSGVSPATRVTTPVPRETVRSGISAAGPPETGMSTDRVVVAVEPPAPSVEVTETDSEKSSVISSPTVSVRPESWSAVSVQEPLPLSVPADRLAPSGTPLMVMLPSVSEPSVSVRPAAILSGNSIT